MSSGKPTSSPPTVQSRAMGAWPTPSSVLLQSCAPKKPHTSLLDTTYARYRAQAVLKRWHNARGGHPWPTWGCEPLLAMNQHQALLHPKGCRNHTFPQCSPSLSAFASSMHPLPQCTSFLNAPPSSKHPLPQSTALQCLITLQGCEPHTAHRDAFTLVPSDGSSMQAVLQAERAADAGGACLKSTVGSIKPSPNSSAHLPPGLSFSLPAPLLPLGGWNG